MPITIPSQRKASERNSPKRSIEIVCRNMGSLISNPSETPKNYNQAAYVRRMSLKDPFKGLNEVTDDKCCIQMQKNLEMILCAW